VRYLTIVRHANAEKAGQGETDFERILSARGQKQCEQLRTWVSNGALSSYGPVTALVSAAARTKETFRRSFAETDFVSDVFFSDLIYNGRRDVTAEDVLIDLAAIDPVTTSLLVVGHNPTVWELALSLAVNGPAQLRQGFPTAGVCVLALPENEQIGRSNYEFVDWMRAD
jgi:phosphohistidine phosphatase